MTTTAVNFATDWGDWRLGDFPPVMEQAVQVVSPGSAIRRIELFPPDQGETRPFVRIEVPRTGDSLRMQAEVLAGEHIADFDPEGTVERWTCVVGGLIVEVRVGGEDR